MSKKEESKKQVEKKEVVKPTPKKKLWHFNFLAK